MKNTHKAPVKQWRKWSQTARHVFNEVYLVIKNGHDTIWPQSVNKAINSQNIKVVAWNTAWIAADAADRR